MRRSMLSISQMHLWQQRPILCVLAEQIRAWNSTTDLPHTLSLTSVLRVGFISTPPCAEVGVEVRRRPIIGRGDERTARIDRAYDRAAPFKSRQVRLEGAPCIVPMEVLSSQRAAKEDRGRMVAAAIGPERLVGDTVKAW